MDDIIKGYKLTNAMKDYSIRFTNRLALSCIDKSSKVDANITHLKNGHTKLYRSQFVQILKRYLDYILVVADKIIIEIKKHEKKLGE